jgi:hypothetical protein
MGRSSNLGTQGPNATKLFELQEAIMQNLGHLGGEGHPMIEVRKDGFHIQAEDFLKLNHASMYLTPWGNFQSASSVRKTTNTILMVLGNSEESFATMADLIPFSQTSSIGDYIIIDRKLLYSFGLGGVRASGYWDAMWKFSDRTGQVYSF